MIQILYQTFLSFFASFFFAILFQVRGKNLLCTACAGSICWFVYAIFLPSSEIIAYFLAAVATTLYAEIFARLLRTPAIVYLAAGVIPLVPGGGIYRTMRFCIRGTPSQALQECIHTIGIAGAMAIGMVLISSIFRFFSYRKHKISKL